MPALDDTKAAITAQTQAIVDLTARIVPPAATAADLAALTTDINTNTASIAALAPPTP
jgi:hypothetical protein